MRGGSFCAFGRVQDIWGCFSQFEQGGGEGVSEAIVFLECQCRVHALTMPVPSACLDDDFREMLEDVWGIEWRRHYAEFCGN